MSNPKPQTIDIDRLAKILGIIIAILSISGVIFTVNKSYSQNYTDSKIVGLSQKLDDTINRLDRIENKLDKLFNPR